MQHKTLRFGLILSLILAFHGLFAQNQNVVFRSKMTFPGQTMANVCGYAANGREYALLGASQGLIIVDVTDPDNPVQIVQIPGPDNLWKEIKTYGHYAYITSEGGAGVQIVDMSNLPASNLPFKSYFGDGEIDGGLQTIHALHIDVTKGYLYAYGSNLFGGGAVILDVHTDPYNPVYAGKFDQLGYIHDGYVDNDTLYGSHIYSGTFSIVNMADKNNPELVNSQNTPDNFTHNTWLSEDRHTIFSTDEVGNSFLAAYDVTNPSDIKLLDKIQSNPGSGSIVHNTHIRGNYAITAWYKDGFTIVDVTHPDNLVQVGDYDTYPIATGGGFDGCWGVYPFLPSGTIIADNITFDGAGEVYFLTPVYTRACYLQGVVTDAATGQPLPNATVEIVGNAQSIKTTGFDGSYKNGAAQDGEVLVSVNRLGYQPATVNAMLVHGEITILNFSLQPAGSVSITGIAVRASDGTPIPNAKVVLSSGPASFEVNTNASGAFSFGSVFAGNYDLFAGAWGYRYKVLPDQDLLTSQELIISLEEGYEDDFIFDYGWEVSGTSLTGIWERAKPIGVDVGILLAPDADVANDLGDLCFVTGNSSGQVDADDVESGTAILTSPVMDLSTYTNPKITANYWCTSFNINQQSLDSISLYISNGQTEVLVGSAPGDNPSWLNIDFNVTDFLPLTSTVRIKLVCRDNPDYTGVDSYEAAFDHFNVVDQPVATVEPADLQIVSAQPNPFVNGTTIQYQLKTEGASLQVMDLLGKVVEQAKLSGTTGAVTIGADLQPGVYFVVIRQENQQSKAIKLIKMQ